MSTRRDLEAGPPPGLGRSSYLRRLSRIIPYLQRLLRAFWGVSTEGKVSAPATAAESPTDHDKKDERKYSDTENDDACEKLWSLYAAEAERYDTTLVESWRGDMEGMLIFSGLFSATVTAFLIESYRSLTPDAGDLTVQLLMRLSQQMAGETISAPAPFHVPSWSIICNTLWFTSLTLSLTCALLATLVEQWAREFLHKTGMRPAPVRRARVLSFLYFGVERFGMPAIVEVLPMLIHLSLLLFFAGLVVFLAPVNEVVMALVAALLGTFLLLYGILTVLPTIALDCPYRTPLSGLAWTLLERLRTLAMGSTLRGPVATLTQAVLKHAFDDPRYRDEKAIFWTVESLTDDNELLPFVEAIPDVVFGPKGFRTVNDHLFGSVLGAEEQHVSLGHRIFNLLRDAGALEDRDPMKLRKQTSSLTAIWALCASASSLPSSRRGDSFLNWLFETHSFLGHSQQLPPALQISCSAVTGSMVIETLGLYVADINQVLEDISTGAKSRSAMQEVYTLTAALGQLDQPFLDSISRHLYPQIMAIREMFPLTGRAMDPSDASAQTNLGRDDPSWLLAKARNTCRMLQKAFTSGSIPFNLEMTSYQVFPELHSPQWPDIRQAALAHSRFDEWQSADIVLWVPPAVYQNPQSLWVYQSRSPQPTQLDYMMRIILRLLPFLRPASCLPLVYWYLANRTQIPSSFQDVLHPQGADTQPFLDSTDKVFIETKFIESMRRVETPAGTLEAAASYYMQSVNSEQTIDRIYFAAAAERGRDSPGGVSLPRISLKATLARAVWGHLRTRLLTISTSSGLREAAEDDATKIELLKEATKIELSKIIQHPFLVDFALDTETRTLKQACALIQRRMDWVYASTVTEIVAFGKNAGALAFRLVPALRAMCTIPGHLSFSAEHQHEVIKGVIDLLLSIKDITSPHGEFNFYRSAVLSLMPPMIDWFTNLTDWDDTLQANRHTKTLVDALAIYWYEHGGMHDRRAIRATELWNHFSHLLRRPRDTPIVSASHDRSPSPQIAQVSEFPRGTQWNIESPGQSVESLFSEGAEDVVPFIPPEEDSAI